MSLPALLFLISNSPLLPIRTAFRLLLHGISCLPPVQAILSRKLRIRLRQALPNGILALLHPSTHSYFELTIVQCVIYPGCCASATEVLSTSRFAYREWCRKNETCRCDFDVTSHTSQKGAYMRASRSEQGAGGARRSPRNGARNVLVIL